MQRIFLGGLLAGLLALPALAQPASFTVSSAPIADQKAVFATVEAAHVVPARARLAGTVAAYTVQDGDTVQARQQIAMVADPAMLQQLHALDADIATAHAQLAQADTDFVRAKGLIGSGAISHQAYDNAHTADAVATSTLRARTAARAALAQQINEGAVLAPVAGRVLLTSITEGTVVEPGDTVASIAEAGYVLRLDIPEEHAALLHVGDPVRLDGDPARFGTITLIYPQIQNGRVEADATAPDTGSYFVGTRVRVWVYAGTRPGLVIPARFIDTRFGLDYADIQTPAGAIAVPVQSGTVQPKPSLTDGVEILSGLKPGDVLLPPGTAP
jgi:RND family efflux transporter MFP subunit